MENPDIWEPSTEKFRKKMKPFAIDIYKKIWPNCEIRDLREHGVQVHILDKEFGVDSLIVFAPQNWISLQEKYRRNLYLIDLKLRVNPKYPDFTQEYKNAYGTKYEQPGEWFKLGAQLYFFGWANKDENGFEKWILLDITKYKIIVEEAGGIEKMGIFKTNQAYGRAAFYAIPINKLWKAVIASHINPTLIEKDNNHARRPDAQESNSRI